MKIITMGTEGGWYVEPFTNKIRYGPGFVGRRIPHQGNSIFCVDTGLHYIFYNLDHTSLPIGWATKDLLAASLGQITFSHLRGIIEQCSNVELSPMFTVLTRQSPKAAPSYAWTLSNKGVEYASN